MDIEGYSIDDCVGCFVNLRKATPDIAVKNFIIDFHQLIC